MCSTPLTMDWRRRHVFDLAWVCQKCKEDSTLSIAQRQAFAETYLAAKRLSSMPQAGGAHSVELVIAQLCSACQGALLHQCQGRSEWQQPCWLMQQRMRPHYR